MCYDGILSFENTSDVPFKLTIMNTLVRTYNTEIKLFSKGKIMTICSFLYYDMIIYFIRVEEQMRLSSLAQ